MIPRQSEKILGIEFLVIGVIFWAAQVVGQIHYLKVRSGHPWSWFVDRAVLAQFATLPFCVLGFAVLFDSRGAFYWLVPGFIFSFAAGVSNAWVLLVEINR